MPGPSPGGSVALLLPNAPNPFGRSTAIRFYLPTQQRVSLAIFDLAGREVARPLRDELRGAGSHRVVFDGLDLPGGVYLCRLSVGASVATRRISHLR